MHVTPWPPSSPFAPPLVYLRGLSKRTFRIMAFVADLPRSFTPRRNQQGLAPMVKRICRGARMQGFPPRRVFLDMAMAAILRLRNPRTSSLLRLLGTAGHLLIRLLLGGGANASDFGMKLTHNGKGGPNPDTNPL
jgi:hypothetical protein